MPRWATNHLIWNVAWRVEEGNCKVSSEWVPSMGSQDDCNDVYELLVYYVCVFIFVYIVNFLFVLSPYPPRISLRDC